MKIDDEERAAALRLLMAARRAGVPGSDKALCGAVKNDPLPPWQLAAIGAWLVRVAAGRFGSAFRDRTDDPMTADSVLREARRSLIGDDGGVGIPVGSNPDEHARQMLRLAALADPAELSDAVYDSASRWHELHDQFAYDSWIVTDHAVTLLRHLSDMASMGAGGIAGDNLTRDALLDRLAAELIERDLVGIGVADTSTNEEKEQ